ncbi:hypothetical protein RhiJN_12146 [Ceratobasidium sp. AG-Ba]|nr:hypothetical protein RhiJN_12146 [Ceratobasidium sp. AG-Ba]
MADARVSSSTSGSSSSSSFASPRTVLPSSLAEFALAHSPPGHGSAPQAEATKSPGSGEQAERNVDDEQCAAEPARNELASPATHLTRGRSKSAARPKANHHHSGSGTPPQMSLDSRPRSPSTPPSRPGVLHRRNNSAAHILSSPVRGFVPAAPRVQWTCPAPSFAPHPRRRDRGRFPEVYLDEDEQPVDESEDDDDEVIRSGSNSNETLPNAARLPSSQGADEFTMDDILDSPARMDIDMLAVLDERMAADSTPTVAPSRIGKRKRWSSSSLLATLKLTSTPVDERYEPYPQKRARGISPTSFSNSTPNPYILPANTVPRSPITTAAPRPTSLALLPLSRFLAVAVIRLPNTSAYAPMMLYGSPIISSPILRPVRGLGLGVNGNGSREERERERQVDGAGNGVKRLDLGS